MTLSYALTRSRSRATRCSSSFTRRRSVSPSRALASIRASVARFRLCSSLKPFSRASFVRVSHSFSGTRTVEFSHPSFVRRAPTRDALFPTASCVWRITSVFVVSPDAMSSRRRRREVRVVDGAASHRAASSGSMLDA
jgi:hypothetical protein